MSFTRKLLLGTVVWALVVIGAWIITAKEPNRACVYIGHALNLGGC